MKTPFNPLIIHVIQWKGSPEYGVIDFAKPLISYNKQEVAMSYGKPFSLSLQKEIEKRNNPVEPKRSSPAYPTLQMPELRHL